MYLNKIKYTVISAAMLAAASAWSVSGGVSYQGMVTDAAGQVVNNAGATMVFSIYNQETSGTPLWMEFQSGIFVSDGLFSVVLGEVEPLPAAYDIRAYDLWLEIEYEGDVMSPRMPLGSVVSALSAADADTLDGLDSSDFVVMSALTSHASDPDAHHMKTTSFGELVDHATDAQIPDDITIDFAVSAYYSDEASYAYNAEMLDGRYSWEFVDQPAFGGHVSDPSAHHVKTVYFSELVDQATDAQIPDDITILHAENADTLDGYDSSDFAKASGIVSIPASALLPRDNGIAYDTNGARMAVPDIGDRVFVAPVLVPDGARLTSVVLEAYDDSGGEFGGHVKMELVRFRYNSAWPMATLDTGISEAPENVRESQALNHTVDNSEYSYGISVTINNGTGGTWSMLFYKAIITYTGD